MKKYILAIVFTIISCVVVNAVDLNCWVDRQPPITSARRIPQFYINKIIKSSVKITILDNNNKPVTISDRICTDDKTYMFLDSEVYKLPIRVFVENDKEEYFIREIQIVQ
jgi:hypothetical protein